MYMTTHIVLFSDLHWQKVRSLQTWQGTSSVYHHQELRWLLEEQGQGSTVSWLVNVARYIRYSQGVESN